MKAFFRRLVAKHLELQVKHLVELKHPIIIAVGGSVGKTSTKNAIATVLKEHYGDKLLVGRENYNSQIGLPLAIFDLPVPERLTSPLAWIKLARQVNDMVEHYPYDVLVLELGTDHPGEMPYYLRYLTPDYGVVTAIAPEHMEFFKTIEAVAKEEFALAVGSKKAVVNEEFAELKRLAKDLTEPLYYSQSLVEGWDLNVLGGHMRQAIAAAVVVAKALGVPEEVIKKGAGKVVPVAGRMQPLEGANGSRIIDDTYNSSPEAAKAALATLREEAKGRKIAIMGSMNELGEYSEQAHAEVGKACGDLDLLVTVGDQAKQYLAPAAIEAGLSKDKVISFDSPYDAGKHVRELLQNNDTVLVKGSQNRVFSEEAAALLLADPADRAKLVRQSPEWIKTKETQFKA